MFRKTRTFIFVHDRIRHRIRPRERCNRAESCLELTVSAILAVVMGETQHKIPTSATLAVEAPLTG